MGDSLDWFIFLKNRDFFRYFSDEQTSKRSNLMHELKPMRNQLWIKRSKLCDVVLRCSLRRPPCCFSFCFFFGGICGSFEVVWVWLVPSKPVSIVVDSKRPKSKPVGPFFLSHTERNVLLSGGSQTFVGSRPTQSGRSLGEPITPIGPNHFDSTANIQLVYLIIFQMEEKCLASSFSFQCRALNSVNERPLWGSLPPQVGSDLCFAGGLRPRGRRHFLSFSFGFCFRQKLRNQSRERERERVKKKSSDYQETLKEKREKRQRKIDLSTSKTLSFSLSSIPSLSLSLSHRTTSPHLIGRSPFRGTASGNSSLFYCRRRSSFVSSTGRHVCFVCYYDYYYYYYRQSKLTKCEKLSLTLGSARLDGSWLVVSL